MIEERKQRMRECRKLFRLDKEKKFPSLPSSLLLYKSHRKNNKKQKQNNRIFILYFVIILKKNSLFSITFFSALLIFSPLTFSSVKLETF